MSDRREERGWSTAGAIGVAVGAGILGGLGYALYKHTQDENSPIRNAMDNFLRSLESCESCEKELGEDDDSIKLLCNHVYHKKCLAKEYQKHCMMSHGQFVCSAHECYFRIPPSVTSSLNTSSPNRIVMKVDSPVECCGPAIDYPKCQICERDLESDDVKLRCNHSYHKSCILGNYVLKCAEGPGSNQYACPMSSCRQLVSPTILESLTKAN